TVLTHSVKLRHDPRVDLRGRVARSSRLSGGTGASHLLGRLYGFHCKGVTVSGVPLPELTQPAPVSLNGLRTAYGSPPSVTTSIRSVSIGAVSIGCHPEFGENIRIWSPPPGSDQGRRLISYPANSRAFSIASACLIATRASMPRPLSPPFSTM